MSPLHVYSVVETPTHPQGLSNSLMTYIYINIYIGTSEEVIQIHKTQSAQISQKKDGRNIYAIMKTIYLSVYRNNGFVATNALEHMYTTNGHHVPKCISSHKAIVVIIRRAHCHIVFMIA